MIKSVELLLILKNLVQNSNYGKLGPRTKSNNLLYTEHTITTITSTRNYTGMFRY